MLEGRCQPYVLAIRNNHCLRFIGEDGFVQTDPATPCDALEAKAWSSHAAGEGSKGLRLYDWARISLPWTCDPGPRWLLASLYSWPVSLLGVEIQKWQDAARLFVDNDLGAYPRHDVLQGFNIDTTAGDFWGLDVLRQ